MRKVTKTILALGMALMISSALLAQNVKFESGTDKFGNTVQLLVFSSPQNLKCDDTVRVYNPEGSMNGTLILLHGWSGCYKDWGNKMDIQKIANEHNFRIITPDGFYNSWYVDNTDKSKMQARTFYNEEFFPFVVNFFHLDSLTTFIDGLSMGGHGAINLFIDNYHYFRGAGSMSGVLELGATTLADELIKVFGDRLEERKISESAHNRISKVAGMDKIVLVSCGYSDYYFRCTQPFVDACKANNVKYIRTDSPGTHSWKFWEFALNQHLWYFNRIIKGEEMGFKK